MKIRFRFHQCKYQKCLFHIHNRWTYQLIVSLTNIRDISKLLNFIQYLYRNCIPNQRFDFLFSENTLCLALIHTTVRYMHIIKPGNSLRNLSLHTLFLCKGDCSRCRCRPLPVSFQISQCNRTRITSDNIGLI